MDIAREKWLKFKKNKVIEVLYKGITSNVIIRIKFIDCLQLLQYL